MRDYKAELREATEELRATMAAYRDGMNTARVERKGGTLLVIRGERSELRGRVR